MREEGWVIIAGIAVFFMFIVAIWVAILNSEKKDKVITEQEYSKKIKKPITVGVISIIVVVISLIGLNNISNSIAPEDYDDEEEIDVKEEIEKKLCTDKTDEYHKCSWSISEDRCVCKER